MERFISRLDLNEKVSQLGREMAEKNYDIRRINAIITLHVGLSEDEETF